MKKLPCNHLLSSIRPKNGDIHLPIQSITTRCLFHVSMTRWGVEESRDKWMGKDLVTYCCTCRRCNSPRWCPSPGKVVHRGWVAARHRIFSWCACSLCRTPTMPTIWTILRPPLLRSPGKEKRGERFEGSSFFLGVVKGTWGGKKGSTLKRR